MKSRQINGKGKDNFGLGRAQKSGHLTFCKYKILSMVANHVDDTIHESFCSQTSLNLIKSGKIRVGHLMGEETFRAVGFP